MSSESTLVVLSFVRVCLCSGPHAAALTIFKEVFGYDVGAQLVSGGTLQRP